jgi:hypothetical protein
MRRVWLVLVIGGLQLAAAEKNRDWKTGQVVESDETTAALHTIAATDRNYLVRGAIGNGDQDLAVGATVRFAIEGKTMFISLAGKEYRLYVLGERVAAPKDAALPPAQAPPAQLPPAPAPKSPPPPPSATAAIPAPAAVKPPPEAVKPPAEASELLDNDAIVKMILGGLKEDTVVRVIETRPGRYILTKDALLGLRAAGVPQSVIAAMSAKMTGRH